MNENYCFIHFTVNRKEKTSNLKVPQRFSRANFISRVMYDISPRVTAVRLAY